MGAERFVRVAKAYGVTLLEEEAAQIAAPWRHDHPMIVQLWLAIQETVEALFQRCSSGYPSRYGSVSCRQHGLVPLHTDFDPFHERFPGPGFRRGEPCALQPLPTHSSR
jgi:hypothetical protein